MGVWGTVSIQQNKSICSWGSEEAGGQPKNGAGANHGGSSLFTEEPGLHPIVNGKT